MKKKLLIFFLKKIFLILILKALKKIDEII